jgi:hypothetical protein
MFSQTNMSSPTHQKKRGGKKKNPWWHKELETEWNMFGWRLGFGWGLGPILGGGQYSSLGTDWVQGSELVLSGISSMWPWENIFHIQV